MRPLLPPRLPWLVLLLWWTGAAGTVSAAPPAPEPAIWSGLLLATNEDHPKELPQGLKKYQKKLGNIFGYNQFDLVGQQTRKMHDSGREHWLVPSKDFCLYVDTHTAAESAYQMKLQLFQNTRRLAEFETRLGPDSPLFIRGPLYAGGQLIIVLLVKDPER